MLQIRARHFVGALEASTRRNLSGCPAVFTIMDCVMTHVFSPLRSNGFRRSLALATATSLGVVGWLVGRPSAAQVTPPDPLWYNCLTREVWSPEKQAWCDKLSVLQNLTYTLPNYGAVPLQNGRYENLDLRFVVVLANQPGWLDFGDLDGDGSEDAVVLIAVNSGGSGQFTYLVPVLDVMGEAQPLQAVFLGDRIQPNALEMGDRTVTLDLVTHGPEDPLCCPTQDAIWAFTLEPTLVPTPETTLPDAVLPAPLPQLSDERDSVPMPNNQATVTGTVFYRERIAMPPSAILEVTLQDISRADAPAVTLATQTQTFEGRQVPIPFELPYDPAQIDERYTYAVRATITVDGQLQFVSDQVYPVITGDNPTEGVEIQVRSPR